MTYAILRDRATGRKLARTHCRALRQAEEGGTRCSNARRLADWRNRYALLPVEMTLGEARKSRNFQTEE